MTPAHFSTCITREPSRSLVKGITPESTAALLGTPNYERAMEQWKNYCRVLEECGAVVVKLPPLEEFPDSCFVEDVAICTKECVVLTRPAALSRRGEVLPMVEALKAHYPESRIYRLEEAAAELGVSENDLLLDGGDVMMVGTHFYVGVGPRTNLLGCKALLLLLKRHGMTGEPVHFCDTEPGCLDNEKILHLKSVVSYLENRRLLVGMPAFVDHRSEIFKEDAFLYCRFPAVDPKEAPLGVGYAANALYVNGQILLPDGKDLQVARDAVCAFLSDNSDSVKAETVVVVDVDEFRKLDGGLSCLSLRF